MTSFISPRRRPDRPLAPKLIVIHPLDDAPETKLDPATAGRMHLTRSVKWSLFALRAYLMLIMLLVVYRVYVIASEAAKRSSLAPAVPCRVGDRIVGCS